MNAGIRRWESTCGGPAGYELMCRPLSPGALAVALRPVLSSAPDGAFLLARLASCDDAGVSAAVRAVHELGATVRIALAIDLATLQCLESNLPESEAVGLILDGVNATTALSAFLLDSIEAVRFDYRFTAAALSNLRMDAALRAMLLLANDLALGTLAWGARSESGPRDSSPRFDYVAQEVAAPLAPMRWKDQATG